MSVACIDASLMKILFEINIFAGVERDVDLLLDLLEQFGVLPGDQSSSHARLYFSNALPRRMQELTPIWPKLVGESGIS